MNNTTKRAYVLYVFIIAFMVGLGIMVWSFYTNGGDWTSNLVNKHIYSNGQIANAGAIYDCKGVALAYSENGVRK